MGLLPDLGPGYHPVNPAGLTLPEMITAQDLDVLWVVGANPLADSPAFASPNAFVVVHEMFMTETAKRADIIFPAASAYEKDGTVTTSRVQVRNYAAR